MVGIVNLFRRITLLGDLLQWLICCIHINGFYVRSSSRIRAMQYTETGWSFTMGM